MFYCCGITDTGSVRDHNEDAFLINRLVMSSAALESNVRSPMIAAVADGVGGESSGEIASRLALQLLSDIKPSPRTDYEKKIMNIHRSLQRHGILHKSENMQTTLCALVVEESGRTLFINVGDSRLYLYRDGKIKQLSRDQSLVQMLYEQGYITNEEKYNHSQKNVIFPVMGSLSDDPKPQITEIEGGLSHGDIVIICSDGLSDKLTSGDFESILAQPKKLPKRLADMVELAISNGSRDNITVVGITCFSDE